MSDSHLPKDSDPLGAGHLFNFRVADQPLPLSISLTGDQEQCEDLSAAKAPHLDLVEAGIGVLVNLLHLLVQHCVVSFVVLLSML